MIFLSLQLTSLTPIQDRQLKLMGDKIPAILNPQNELRQTSEC